jgi:transcriptional regulator with XRE-family HTH domain
LTQGELGRRVGVDQGAVSKWELRKTVPPAAKRTRLAELAAGAGLEPPLGRGDDEG